MSKIDRRQLLTAAPAAGLAALVVGGAPAGAACAVPVETPVAIKFREWRNFRDSLCGPAYHGISAEGYNRLVEMLDEFGAELLLIPSQTPQDFIMKVIARTDFGHGGMPDETAMPDLWAEARALVSA